MTTVITGAANGVGRAVALTIVSTEEPLVLVDVDERALASPATELEARHVRIATVVGSVASEAVTERTAEASAAFGGATGWSHSAGIQRYGTATDTTPDAWDEVDGHLGKPDEIAGVCAFLAPIDGAFVTGQAIDLHGGITI